MLREGSNAEVEAVKQVAHTVIEAIVRGDAELARQVFHSDATITGQKDGVLVRCDVQTYIEHCRRLRTPRRGVGKRYEVAWLDVSGPVGAMKLHESYPSGDLTTYMTVSKVNGRWLVNNRTLFGAIESLPRRPTLT